MSVNALEDLKGEFNKTTLDSSGDTTYQLLPLPAMFIRNIILLQQWYKDQASIDQRIWLSLSQDNFVSWEAHHFHTATTSVAPMASLPTMPIVNQTFFEAAIFQRSIKRSPADYTKFKDDNRWKQWHRHLMKSANSHGLNDVLNPDYVPITPEEIELFRVQNNFMYSVFEQSMHTAKSRHVVQTHDVTANAQLVYAGLFSAYDEDISTSLAATDLRSELTLLRFDDTWKRGSETLLQHWKSKILELEQLENETIHDATKRR
jgi:hypothetical protein